MVFIFIDFFSVVPHKFLKNHCRFKSFSCLILHLTDDILSNMDLLKCISKRGLTLITLWTLSSYLLCCLLFWHILYSTVLRCCARINFIQRIFYDCLVLHKCHSLISHWPCNRNHSTVDVFFFLVFFLMKGICLKYCC